MELRNIPVVILAGGKGTRFNSETEVTPKPMIKIDGKPMVQHIIDSFVKQGLRNFIVATGYLGEAFRCYFAATCHTSFYSNEYRFEIPAEMLALGETSGAWYTVRTIDTGEDSHTGERLFLLRDRLWSRFILTYGDGLSDVNMRQVLSLHESTCERASQQLQYGLAPIITVTAVNPPGRFGVVEMDGCDVVSFDEKPIENRWINGGFMVIEPEFIPLYLEGPGASAFKLETEAMHWAASHGRMIAFRHHGYWQCVDTRRDLEQVEEQIKKHGCLPWSRTRQRR